MLEEIHDFLCEIPLVGDLYNENPIIGYGMSLIITGLLIWWYFLGGKGMF